jgi:anaphase-promoting complex subunit 2
VDGPEAVHIAQEDHILAVQGVLLENTPNTFSSMEEGGMKRGPGLGDMSGINHSLDLEEDSITASSADQREEELGMFWSYILGMLTNLESLPLERIYQMLRIFAMQEDDSKAEVQKLKRDWKS